MNAYRKPSSERRTDMEMSIPLKIADSLHSSVTRFGVRPRLVVWFMGYRAWLNITRTARLASPEVGVLNSTWKFPLYSSRPFLLIKELSVVEMHSIIICWYARTNPSKEGPIHYEAVLMEDLSCITDCFCHSWWRQVRDVKKSQNVFQTTPWILDQTSSGCWVTLLLL